MRKAIGHVLFNGETMQLRTFAVTHKGNLITLAAYRNGDPAPYKYERFNDLYRDILSIAKENGFTFDSFHEFDADFYNIVWVDTSAPYALHKYGYHKALHHALCRYSHRKKRHKVTK